MAQVCNGPQVWRTDSDVKKWPGQRLYVYIYVATYVEKKKYIKNVKKKSNQVVKLGSVGSVINGAIPFDSVYKH